MGSDFEVIGSVVVSGDGTVKIQGLNKELDTMATKTSGLGGMMKSFGQAATFAFGNLLAQGISAAGRAISDFATSSIQSFRDSQDVIANLNATVASTGGIAGVTSEAAQALAKSLQSVTKFSDESIGKGEAMLLTFTNIGKDVFPQATEAMLNLAQKMGTDAAGSAIQLGKALNDPVRGMTALRRVGVAFTQAQEDSIKAFMAQGDVASAQKIILGELQTEFGGLAKAMGATASGQMEIMKNKVDDIKEGIGELIQGGIGALYGQLSNSGAIDVFGGYVNNLVNAFRAGGAGSKEFKNALLSIIPEGIREKIQTLFGGFSVLGQKIKPFITDVLGRLSAWFKDNGPLIQQFMALMIEAWTTRFVPTIVAVWGIIQPILSGIIDLVLGLAKTIMQIATGDWSGAWETIKSTALSVVTNLWEAIKGLLNVMATSWGSSLDEVTASIKAWASHSWSVITGWIHNTLTSIKGWFTNIIQGFINWRTTTTSTVNGFGTNIINSIKNIFSNMVNAFKTGLLIIFGLWIMAWNALLAPFGTSMTEIIQTTIETFDAIRTFIANTLNAIINIAKSALNTLMSNLSSAWSSIRSTLVSAWNSIVSAISGPLNNIISKVSSMISSLKSSISSGLSGIKSYFSTAVSDWLATISSSVSRFTLLGVNIVGGLVQGIKNAAFQVINVLKNLIKEAISTAMSTLGIQSPSKIFFAIGQQIPAGLAKGIEDAFAIPVASMQAGLTKMQVPALAMAGGGLGGSNINASQNYNNSHHHHYYGTVIMQTGNGGGGSTPSEFLKATRK